MAVNADFNKGDKVYYNGQEVTANSSSSSYFVEITSKDGTKTLVSRNKLMTTPLFDYANEHYEKAKENYNNAVESFNKNYSFEKYFYEMADMARKLINKKEKDINTLCQQNNVETIDELQGRDYDRALILDGERVDAVTLKHSSSAEGDMYFCKALHDCGDQRQASNQMALAKAMENYC